MATGMTLRTFSDPACHGLAVSKKYFPQRSRTPSPTPLMECREEDSVTSTTKDDSSGSDGDHEDQKLKIACSSFRMVPSSLASLFRKAGRSLAVDSAISRSKTPSPSSPERSQASLTNIDPQTGKPHYKGQKTSPVKNIYRKPASRAVSRPRADSCTIRSVSNVDQQPYNLRHASFSVTSCALKPPSGRQNYDDVNSVDDNNTSGLETRRVTMDTALGPEDSESCLYRHRPRASSMPALPQSILRRRRQPLEATTYCHNNKQTSSKHACFKNEVDVYYFDVGNAKNRPRQTEGDPQTSNSQKDEGGLQTDSPCKDESIRFKQVYHQNQSSVVKTAKHKVSDNEIECSVDTHVIPCIDAQGHRTKRLRITLKTDGKYIREKTNVKSLSGGGAIIVQMFSANDASDARPHVKKLPLPVIIDPYHVKAHVHKDGVLTVEATIVEEFKD